MIFPTRINGIPCQCEVTHYEPALPGSFTEPPQPGEFEFRLLDRRGYPARWLDKHITSQTEDQLFQEFKKHLDDLAFQSMEQEVA